MKSNTYIYIIFLVLISTICWGQDNESIPVSIFVENSVFIQPVHNANVVVELREDYGGNNVWTETIKELKTDELGYATLSLKPNKSYMVSIFRNGFFSQLAKLNTTEFARTDRNKTKISLRPRDLLTIAGKIVSNKEMDIVGTVSLIHKHTNSKQINAIKSTGNYKIQGIKGEDYQLHVFVENFLDTIVNVDDLEQQVYMGEPSFVLDIPIAIETETKQKAATEWIVQETGDSTVLEQVQFVGKTVAIFEEEWIDTLCQKLIANPDVKIKLSIHTDSRKSHRFNRILAEKRAKILKEILLTKNIPEEQVFIDPKGEEGLLHDCGRSGKKCTTKQHAENNRVLLVVEEGEFLY